MNVLQVGVAGWDKNCGGPMSKKYDHTKTKRIDSKKPNTSEPPRTVEEKPIPSSTYLERREEADDVPFLREGDV